MSECYNIEISDGKLVFGKRELGVPGCVIRASCQKPGTAWMQSAAWATRIFLQCLVYRRENARAEFLPCGTNMARCLRLLPKARLFTLHGAGPFWRNDRQCPLWS